MKTTVRLAGVFLFIGAMTITGCYTQLMTPEEYVRSGNEHPVIRPDMSSDLQYSSNCLNCHSRRELDDRYNDMMAYGITTAHGFVIDPAMWTDTNLPVYDPPYFPGPGGITVPWWLPPPVIVTTPAPAAPSSGDKKRTAGPTRDPNNRPGTDTPSPTVGSSGAPVGGTTTAPATPPPASSTSTTSSPPPSTDRDRSSDSGSNSGTSSRPRTDSPSRDDGGRKR